MEWNKDEIRFLKTLKDPDKIQCYLDSIEYNAEYTSRSPRWVMIRQSAHCFEGALFAAAALQFIGYKPLIVDMLAENDDDHVIAIFRKYGYWGAIAKSNFTTLRFREPVYRSLRELVMSYFDFFFNIDGEKSLRSYSRPFDLSTYESLKWYITDDDLEFIGDKIESLHHYPVISDQMVRLLNKASVPVMEAGLLGSKPEGLYKPEKNPTR